MKSFCPHPECPSHALKFPVAFHDCISDPGKLPEEGDIGICADCGGWWTIKDGTNVDYVPTKEELAQVMAEMSAARERYAEHRKLVEGRR